ncbi:MAG: hypothetical protein IPK42_13275 [Betaproteobacteria bacterium]|nr:hypothetical protein [Betaproteobacteria bacterium]
MALLSGCAINMKVPVKDPAPSAVKYEQAEKSGAMALYFKDDQPAAVKGNILSGSIPMQMTYRDKPFDAAPWIAQHTVAELIARGAAASLAQSDANATTVSIKQIHVENHRVSGFSPFVTFTSVSADLMLLGGPQRITAYVKRGKVPVWSFDEIIEPTFNEPLNLLTKEQAAKINQRVFMLAASDKQVTDLVALITTVRLNGPPRADSQALVRDSGRFGLVPT